MAITGLDDVPFDGDPFAGLRVSIAAMYQPIIESVAGPAREALAEMARSVFQPMGESVSAPLAEVSRSIALPITESIAAPARVALAELARSIASPLADTQRVVLGAMLKDFKPPVITLAPGVLEAMMPAIKFNKGVIEVLRPSMDVSRAVVESMIREASVSAVRQGGVVAPSSTTSSVPKSTSVAAWWTGLTLGEQLAVVYGWFIFLQVVAHAGHTAVNPDLNYNPAAALMASVESVLPNAVVTLSAFIIARRMGK